MERILQQFFNGFACLSQHASGCAPPAASSIAKMIHPECIQDFQKIEKLRGVHFFYQVSGGFQIRQAVTKW